MPNSFETSLEQKKYVCAVVVAFFDDVDHMDNSKVLSLIDAIKEKNSEEFAISE